MPRPPRIQLENCLYHLYNRGNNKGIIFPGFSDYEKFLSYLTVTKRKYQFYLYAYALMPNHYHLLIETSLPNIASAMQYLITSYAMYHNTKYKKNGHLFQGRYKSIIVDRESYFLELTRYIHLNPVRAKLIQTPLKYKWSSYREYVEEIKPLYVDKTRLSNYFDLWGKKYADFIEENKNKKFLFQNQIGAGCILGSPKAAIEKVKSMKNLRRQKFLPGRASYTRDEVLNCVANFYGISKTSLCRRNTKPVLARRVVAYLLRQKTALRRCDIAQLFKVTDSAITQMLQRFERQVKEDIKVQKQIEEILQRLDSKT